MGEEAAYATEQFAKVVDEEPELDGNSSTLGTKTWICSY